MKAFRMMVAFCFFCCAVLAIVTAIHDHMKYERKTAILRYSAATVKCLIHQYRARTGE